MNQSPKKEEKKCCEKCTYHASIPSSMKESQIYGTEYCGFKGCFCHSPSPSHTDVDAWKKDFLKEWDEVTGGEAFPNFIFPFIESLISLTASQDYKKGTQDGWELCKQEYAPKVRKETASAMKKSIIASINSAGGIGGLRHLEEIIDKATSLVVKDGELTEDK